MSTHREPASNPMLSTFLAVLLLSGFLVTAAPAADAAPLCRGERGTVVGTPEADVLEGTAGRDVIVGLGGRDQIRGLGGDDLVCGGARSDDIDPGAGNDGVSAGRANDAVWPSPGDDDVFGGRGSDYLYAGAGQDRIFGGPGRTDVIRDGAGNSVIDGGPGTGDLVIFDTASAVTVDLAAGTASGHGSDSLARVESVVGSASDDVIIGNDRPNWLSGRAGDDVLTSGGGGMLGCPNPRLSWPVLPPLRCADVLEGGDGDNTLDGGDGLDVVRFSDSPVTVDLEGGTATEADGTDTLTNIEAVEGSQWDDVLIGDDADNVFAPLLGNDVVQAGAGVDLIVFLGGATTVDLGAGTATSAADPFFGSDPSMYTISGIEDVRGTRYADTITGDPGPNHLMGLEGGDTISGGEGDDVLDGGAGIDVLDGGPGTDVCLRAEKTIVGCEG